jgi:hypothetical protein
MRVEELYERRQQRDVTRAKAVEMLGVTERTVSPLDLEPV